MAANFSHIKILSDNINGITKDAIKRMVLKAGCKEVGSMCYEEIRGVLKLELEKILRDTVTYTEHNQAVRVQVKHVQKALEGLGKDSYARICGQRTQRPVEEYDNPRTVKNCTRKSPGKCSANVHYKSRSVGRWHKGTSSLAAMRKLQKQSRCHHFGKLPFQTLIREVAQDFKMGLQFSPEALDMIQTAVEAYLLDILQNACMATVAMGRVRMRTGDIQLALKLRRD